MKLIVGLGNPGKKYENTRHNIGFKILEKVAEKREVVFRLESMYEARFAEMGELENRIKLVEPQTFMNESGRAVSKIKNYWKIDSEDIWVIHDDVDLKLGKIKVVLGGSSAGHKGVQSIIDNIGNEFWRIRVGVGRSTNIPTDEWVLQQVSKDESEKYEEIIDRASVLVIESLDKGIEEKVINVN